MSDSSPTHSRCFHHRRLFSRRVGDRGSRVRSQHTWRRSVVDRRGVLIRQGFPRMVESIATGQRTPLFELADTIAFRQGRPAHVGQQLLLDIEGRHELLGCAGLGAVKVVHVPLLPLSSGIILSITSRTPPPQKGKGLVVVQPLYFRVEKGQSSHRATPAVNGTSPSTAQRNPRLHARHGGRGASSRPSGRPAARG